MPGPTRDSTDLPFEVFDALDNPAREFRTASGMRVVEAQVPLLHQYFFPDENTLVVGLGNGEQFVEVENCRDD